MTTFTFDDLLMEIARDCLKKNTHKQFPAIEFTAKENKKYRELEKSVKPSYGFWGGYAYVDAIEGRKYGFIRLYSPQGSAKWGFDVENNKVTDVYVV